jgi:phosphate transport system substrate-binding protein
LVRIAYLPSLSPITELIKFCISAKPQDYFVVNEIPTLSSQVDSDLIFWLGEKPASLHFAAPIGWESFSIVLNPKNPLQKLAGEEIRALYSGEVTNWNELGGDDQPVSVWVYPEEDEIQDHFSLFHHGDRPITSLSFLATSPVVLREAVANDPGAIGVLPNAWIDDSVSPIQLDIEYPSLPILVLSINEPSGAARNFIACLQSPQGQAAIQERYQPWEK